MLKYENSRLSVLKVTKHLIFYIRCFTAAKNTVSFSCSVWNISTLEYLDSERSECFWDRFFFFFLLKDPPIVKSHIYLQVKFWVLGSILLLLESKTLYILFKMIRNNQNTQKKICPNLKNTRFFFKISVIYTFKFPNRPL